MVPPATVPRVLMSSFFMMVSPVCLRFVRSGCRGGDQQCFLDLALPQEGAGGGQAGAGGGQTGAQMVPPAMVPRVFRSRVFIGVVLEFGAGFASRSQS
jgi:hypothetical protein